MLSDCQKESFEMEVEKMSDQMLKRLKKATTLRRRLMERKLTRLLDETKKD